MSPPKFCEQCGAALAPGVRFCESCGQPVQLASATSAPVAATPLPPLRSAVPEPLEAPAPPRARLQPQPARANTSLLLIGLGLVLVLALLAVGVTALGRKPSTPAAVTAVITSQPLGAPAVTVVVASAPAAQLPAAEPEAVSPASTLPDAELEIVSPASALPAANPPPGGEAPATPGQPAAAAEDPAALLAAAQAQVALLQGTRFSFERFAYGLRDPVRGQGWLQMPDRALYTLGTGGGGSQELIVRNELWVRDSPQADWSQGLQPVALVANPALWLRALNCVSAPRLLKPEMLDGQMVDGVAFEVMPSDPGQCDPYTGLLALNGSGAVWLRQRDGGIQRVGYGVHYTDALHGGHQDVQLIVTMDLSDWNAADLPPINTPGPEESGAVPAPTPKPAATANRAAPPAGAGPAYGPVAFSSEFDQDRMEAVNPTHGFAHGVPIVFASWTYRNAVPNAEIVTDWYRDGEFVGGAAEYLIGTSGTSFQWLLPPGASSPQAPLEAGKYEFVVRIGGEPVLSDTFVIQP